VVNVTVSYIAVKFFLISILTLTPALLVISGVVTNNMVKILVFILFNFIYKFNKFIP
jgi:heme/copper-type cytochrome/quinol oxidase subunit 4